MKPGIDVIVSKLPPPGKLKGGAAEDAADGGADDDQEYSPAEDAMSAFIEAVGGDKAKAPEALDAFRDLVKQVTSEGD